MNKITPQIYHPDLLERITVYCEDRGLSPTRFGMLSANDPNLVRQVRAGRLLRPETVAKLEVFMSSGSQVRPSTEADQSARGSLPCLNDGQSETDCQLGGNSSGGVAE